MEKVDLNKYKDFVEKVTSIQSNETGALSVQLEKLEHDSGVNMALLLTGAIGIASEGGEYAEIVIYESGGNYSSANNLLPAVQIL